MLHQGLPYFNHDKFGYLSFQESGRISEERNSSSSQVDSKKTPTTENKSNGSSSGFFGLNFSGVYAPLLTRTRSATDAVVQQTRSSSS